jgi:hypothetical protein
VCALKAIIVRGPQTFTLGNDRWGGGYLLRRQQDGRMRRDKESVSRGSSLLLRRAGDLDENEGMRRRLSLRIRGEY